MPELSNRTIAAFESGNRKIITHFSIARVVGTSRQTKCNWTVQLFGKSLNALECIKIDGESRDTLLRVSHGDRPKTSHS
jgi:hypothetical protein